MVVSALVVVASSASLVAAVHSSDASSQHLLLEDEGGYSLNDTTTDITTTTTTADATASSAATTFIETLTIMAPATAGASPSPDNNKDVFITPMPSLHHVETLLYSLRFIKTTIKNALDTFGGSDYKSLQRNIVIQDQLKALAQSLMSQLFNVFGYSEKQDVNNITEKMETAVLMTAFTSKLLNASNIIDYDKVDNKHLLHMRTFAVKTLDHALLGLLGDDSVYTKLQGPETNDKFKTLLQSNELADSLMHIRASLDSPHSASNNLHQRRLSRRFLMTLLFEIELLFMVLFSLFEFFLDLAVASIEGLLIYFKILRPR